MEKEYYRKLRLNGKELLEIFPEAEEIISQEVKEVKEKVDTDRKGIENMLIYIHSLNLDSTSEWFAKKIVESFHYPKLVEEKRNLMRLDRLKRLCEPRNNYMENFERKLERARNYPILEVASKGMKLKKSGSHFVGLCPFHREKTPSCFIYPESNRFHCFGCGESGDIISLTQYLYGVDFKDAVELLQN